MPTFMRDTTRFVTSEIVGGQSAPAPIPWQVSIQGVNCGGTILDAYTVLSAGHCFDQGVTINGKSIRAGSTQRSSGGQVSLSFAILISHYKFGPKDFSIDLLIGYLCIFQDELSIIESIGAF